MKSTSDRHADTSELEKAINVILQTDWQKIAQAIHNQISGFETIEKQLIRIKLPSL